jgi:Fibronectin type III domain
MNTPVVSGINSTSTIGGISRCTHVRKTPLKLIGFSALLAVSLALAAPAHASQSVSIAWNAESDPNVAGYAVYLGATNGTYTSRFDVGTNTQITVSSLGEGQTYYFAVAAYDSARMEGTKSTGIPYLVPGLVRAVFSAGPGSPMNISFPVANAHWYQVQASTNLRTWTNVLQTPVESVNSWVTYQDSQHGPFAMRFYRLIMN